MKSTEKIAALRAEAMGPPGADADPMELAIRTAARFAGPMLEQLPDDPDALDHVLVEAAQFFLELRSDDARVLAYMFLSPESHVGQPATSAPPPELPAA